MNDADLVLIDMDPNDPLDFYLEHYKEQLSAGYTKITPGSGLRVYIKDYNKLHPTKRLSATTRQSEVEVRNRSLFVSGLATADD